MVRDLTQNVPPDVVDELLAFRYRQEFHLSYREFLNEPQAAVEQAIFIWSLEAERDKLEKKRRQK